MPTSLFIEHHVNGLAFYLNGDLQFDTADEAIYHENLVIPAIALASQRFPATPLRVLICGGGDGLAARDALRFSQVAEITLVDYDPAVLELGRTVFQPYNQGSLLGEHSTCLGANHVTVYTQEAFEFLSALPDACYHVVICDFTFPTGPDDTQIYSQEWFQQVQRVLYPAGVMSTNGVSPEQRTHAFWCIYQTLLASGLHTKPMQLTIPSFQRHGYGDWGFFLASPTPVMRAEVEALQFPPQLRVLHGPAWLGAFEIPVDLARDRHRVNLHTLACPQLLYYILNPSAPLDSVSSDSWDSTHALIGAEGAIADNADNPVINFLDLQETGTGQIGSLDFLQLESTVKVWLEHLRQAQQSPSGLLVPESVQTEHLLPVQHRYHSPHMTQEWLNQLRSLLAGIDGEKLIASLLERAQELPPQLAQELKQLGEKLRKGQPLTYLSEHTGELITILSVTLLMANLTSPDAVFAKGGYYGSSGTSSNLSSGSVDDGEDKFGFTGFSMLVVGVIWLINLYKKQD